MFHGQTPSRGDLRISLPMGPSFNRHAGAIDWIQSRFRRGPAGDLVFRRSTILHLLRRFERMCSSDFLSNGAAGIFHCGGPRPHDAVSDRAGGQPRRRLSAGAAQGLPAPEAGPMPPRAGNVSMNSGKLSTELGEQPFQPWPLGDDLQPTDRQWHHERPGGESAVGGRDWAAALSVSASSACGLAVSIADHAFGAIDEQPRQGGEQAHAGDAIEDAIPAVFLLEIAEDGARDETAQVAHRVDDAEHGRRRSTADIGDGGPLRRQAPVAENARRRPGPASRPGHPRTSS